MLRFLTAALAALLLLPAAASAKALPRAHPVDLGAASYAGDPGLPGADAKQDIPGWLESWSESDVRSAADYPGPVAKEERYQDQDGHVLTLGTDNAAVDLQPFANLLATTYHGGEIELIKAFVTDTPTLENYCGSDAVACYAGDNGPTGLMVVSYQSDNMEHAVIHEYGHHIDNNSYNFAGQYGCGVDGDGSRRWYLARERRDRITRRLSCDPNADWGHLLPEVFAEDYAQMVGIPASAYHPAISVPYPSAGMLSSLRADIDNAFEPTAYTITGRSGRKRRVTGKLKLRSPVPVFLDARNAKHVKGLTVSGCSYRGVDDVYSGTCRLHVTTKRPRQKFSFRMVER